MACNGNREHMTEIETMSTQPLVLIRGVGDVGSAVAWALFQAGFCVISHEDRQPRTIRRKMAFCDALWLGECELEGVRAVRHDRVENVLSFAHSRLGVALYGGSFETLLATVRPDILVDARIQKFASVEALKGQAELSIGIGPGFVAREHVDVVIESCWGETLGEIIEKGSAVAPVAEPPALNGIGWERFVRAQVAGRFESELEIGQYVEAGTPIGRISGGRIVAPLSGFVRGLIMPGLSVIKGEKICEIDPRQEQARYRGLAERPSGIAKGVLQAIRGFLPGENHPKRLKDIIDQWDNAFSVIKAEIC